MENKETITTEAEFQECRNTLVNGFTCKCETINDCAFYTPTAVDELDLEEMALKLYPVVMYNDTDSFTPKQYDNNLYNRNAYKKGYTDHAKTKQSKLVDVIEGEIKLQENGNSTDNEYTVDVLRHLLTKLKQ